MTVRQFRATAGAAALVFLVLAGCAVGGRLQRVVYVIDGDTLVLAGGERVRLLGVDTPETHHPEVPVQRFGQEASAFTKKVATDRLVRLEAGPQERDAYGRLLAYVWMDGNCLNRELVRRGYAVAATRFPHPRMDEFLAAEAEARAKKYGLWHDSPTDGRLAGLLHRWERLSTEGKRLLDDYWDELLETHAAPDLPAAETPAAPTPASE
ncbi:MAG: thermonuclease family protein [Deltaproteobacteria bacterium]|nr:thermonuclease family protein [Deltaproteobacteria bacterium]